MKISVVIPAYNGEKFIRQCIQSVLNQMRKPDQVAVVIDESSDHTEAICQEFGNRIEIYHNSPATGFVDAWNRAVGKARYEWVCLLHQDDLLKNDFLENAENIISEFPEIQYVYGRCDYIDDNGISYWSPDISGPRWQKQSGSDYIMSYMDGNANRCPGVIAHRDVFQKIPFRNEPGLVADNDFFWRVGFQYDVVRINAVEASFRHHPDSATHSFKNLDGSMFEEYVWLYEDYLKNNSFNRCTPEFKKRLAQWIFKPFTRNSLSLLSINKINDFCQQKRNLNNFLKKNNIYLSKYPLKLSEKLCCCNFPWIIPWSANIVFQSIHKKRSK